MVIRLGRAVYTVVAWVGGGRSSGCCGVCLCRKRNKAAELFPENAIIRSPEITGPNYPCGTGYRWLCERSWFCGISHWVWHDNRGRCVFTESGRWALDAGIEGHSPPARVGNARKTRIEHGASSASRI